MINLEIYSPKNTGYTYDLEEFSRILSEVVAQVPGLSLNKVNFDSDPEYRQKTKKQAVIVFVSGIKESDELATNGQIKNSLIEKLQIACLLFFKGSKSVAISVQKD